MYKPHAALLITPDRITVKDTGEIHEERHDRERYRRIRRMQVALLNFRWKYEVVFEHKLDIYIEYDDCTSSPPLIMLNIYIDPANNSTHLMMSDVQSTVDALNLLTTLMESAHFKAAYKLARGTKGE